MTTLLEKMKEMMKEHMTLRGLASGTQEQYLRATVKLYNYYHRSPAQLTDEEIKTFLLSVLSEEAITPSTYNVMIHGLKFFYEVVLRKTMVEVFLPRTKEPQKLPDILSRSEVTRIIKATTNLKHRTILMIIYGAGLRASEIVALKVKDIDSERGMIHIRQGKGGKDRYVTLSPVMLDALRTYWKLCRRSDAKRLAKESNINDFVFVSQLGKAVATVTIGAIYKRAKKLAGIIDKQGGVHALRHAFATHALESGVPLYTVKQLLGHSSITTTVRYLHVSRESLTRTPSPIEQLRL